MLPKPTFYPTQILYVSSVVIVTLFVMAFLWLALFSAISPLRTSIAANMAQYDVENTTYASFELAEAFMNNVWIYFLVVVVFGLLYWCFIYSQRKNDFKGKQ